MGQQLSILSDIKSIVSSMKNLAFIEITKLSRFISAHDEMSAIIADALDDFEHYFVASIKGADKTPPLYIILGSERGFCGGFNERIVEKLFELSPNVDSSKLLVIGRKLVSKCKSNFGPVAALDGPNALEEIPRTLSALTAELKQRHDQKWILIHNILDGSHTRATATDPFQRNSALQLAEPEPGFPPLLNMQPQTLYPQLFEQYLFSVFYHTFYMSFLAENHERLRHMDGALNSLEKRSRELQLKRNMIRQEEITEELELLLMNKPKRHES
jgi:F-type H+-transporting ATPase subunit gamma